MMEAVAQTKEVATRISKMDFTGALSLRDPEFEECLEAFYATTRLDDSRNVPENQRMRVGIVQ
jgi:6-phosphofructokinase 1